ncbi:hypothetical protein [Lonsdalea britannica]|uniref:hypothetical protein n=1 Tax=Lonsdalea britannica TaxID=1082704 RepID=UPI00111C5D31|nr:hypothetical protein [Lonsdalea britannica]
MTFSAQIMKNGRLAIAPTFTPMVLVQVIDVAAGAGGIPTIVPSSSPFMAFHRSIESSMDGINWVVDSSGAYVVLNFNSAAMKSTSGRIYIFSNFVVNVPEYGLYVYSEGRVVYHNNCLPLKVNTISYNQSEITSSAPLAVCSCVTEVVEEFYPDPDPYSAKFQVIERRRASAGYESGSYKVTFMGVLSHVENLINHDIDPPTYPIVNMWNVNTIAYIECSLYDQYYKQALGY